MAVKRPWSCPICGGNGHRPLFRAATASLDGMEAGELRPASDRFGTTLGAVARCRSCGHGSLLATPEAETLADTYAHVEDQSSLEEEDGQVATARRDLHEVRDHLTGSPSHLLDVGCWTGSLLDAAAELGWTVEGVEPSDWAASQAAARGHAVAVGTLGKASVDRPTYQVVVCCDVLEHLIDPSEATTTIVDMLEPNGLLFATVPDAGSVLARVLGRRWWSVLPMHVQYFTRGSLVRLLEGSGLEVVAMRTHPKVFTRRYYADRLREFSPVGGSLVGAVSHSRWAERPFVPDFRDRIAVIARRPATSEGAVP